MTGYPVRLEQVEDLKDRELREKKAREKIEEYLTHIRVDKHGNEKIAMLTLYSKVRLLGNLSDQYYVLGETELMRKYLHWLIKEIRAELPSLAELKPDHLNSVMFWFRRAHVYLAAHEFPAYLKVMEWNFPEENKFFANRICVMGEWAKELEKLEHGEYDLLGLSAPPRSGKTGIGTLFLTWLMGRHPEKSMLFATHTGRMARKEYMDIYNLITDPRRCWNEIFRGMEISKSAEDLWIDVSPKKSPNNYRTMYCTSIDASKAGVMEASHLIYCDDLIGGIEEAMNPVRLDTAWEKYTTDILQRKNGPVKILHIATRWSVRDPLTRLADTNEDNPRARFICVPGLNEEGESNFNFKYNPLDKHHFEMLRESMDPVSFSCIVQQSPVERDGIVFTRDSLSYYDGVLPGTEPDEVVFATDVAFGGGDYLCMLIAYVYGMDVYVHDVVYSKGTKEETRPLVANAILQHGCSRGFMEANAGGEDYADWISARLKKDGFRCMIETKRAPVTKTKLNRILGAQSEIKCSITDGTGFRLHFLSAKNSPRSQMYEEYMKHLTSFNQGAKFIGKQKDDAADATASLVTNVLYRNTQSPTLKVIRGNILAL